MKPRIPITSPDFKWTSAVETDVRKTWAKARRRIAQEAEAERAQKVTQLKRKA